MGKIDSLKLRLVNLGIFYLYSQKREWNLKKPLSKYESKGPISNLLFLTF